MHFEYEIELPRGCWDCCKSPENQASGICLHQDLGLASGGLDSLRSLRWCVSGICICHRASAAVLASPHARARIECGQVEARGQSNEPCAPRKRLGLVDSSVAGRSHGSLDVKSVGC